MSETNLRVADAHNDLLMAVQHFKSRPDYFGREWLPELRRGRVAVQVLPIFVEEDFGPENALRRTLQLLETALRLVETYKADLALCLEPGDVRRAISAGKIGVILALEGCPAITNEIELLGTFHRMGVRILSFTHFGRTMLADGSAEEGTGSALTRLGALALESMADLHMILDVSHLSLAGTQDVLRRTRRPVIATHSSCYALRQHHRNLRDAELKAIADTDGVVGINFFPEYLADADVAAADVVRHVMHALTVAGTQHVGIGADFTRQLSETLPVAHGVLEGSELGSYVPGLSKPSELPHLAALLSNEGLDEETVAAVMGGNFIRFLNEHIGRDSRDSLEESNTVRQPAEIR